MRYGNDDRADVTELEEQKRRSQRWVQLGLMRKRALVSLYNRMMRERGSVSLTGGPVTAQDYRSAIMCLEQADEGRAKHLAEYGPGHEKCPSIDFQPTCAPALIDRIKALRAKYGIEETGATQVIYQMSDSGELLKYLRGLESIFRAHEQQQEPVLMADRLAIALQDQEFTEL